MNVSDRVASISAEVNGLVFKAFRDKKLSGFDGLRSRTSGLLSSIEVSPWAIEFKCDFSGSSSWRSLLFRPGDWDLDKREYSEVEAVDDRYVSCKEVLVDRLPVDSLSEYKRKLEIIKEKGSVQGIFNEGDLRFYMDNVCDMYFRIAKSGKLMSQSDLGLCPYVGGIRCVVGRNGELMGTDDGNHRLAISRLLKFEKIPVQVACIHLGQLDEVKSYFSGSVLSAVNRYLLNLSEKFS